MNRVLFPGRFQPFHRGHLAVVERLLEEFDEIVVVIGSAQEGFTCRNPFTAGERIEMLTRLFRDEHVFDRVWLIPVPDIHMPMAWTTHVLSLTPRVNAVASGNPHVLELFKWVGFKTVRIEPVEPDKYSGTRIRQLIVEGSEEWRSLVPYTVAEYMEEVGGVERIREVCVDEHSRNRR
ncbi:nicotinamide-nucleotide adenylyltransferase [Desulfurococcus mucosus]|uniref:nicotinamide-nucleotide adenylyltransferase n=1 Tax=Desulfurococcus mucosus TaxID=2275 RepID=UPI00064E5B48|nr:nicotinamide-nucleotide adenylyltransferase [Desulfurococcus mucosus]